MPPRFQNPPSLLIPGLLALLGAAYCLFIYLGLGDAVCITAGCSLYKSFSIAGISMWIFGLIAFVSLVLLLAAGAYSLSLLLSKLFLAADCLLLLIMVSTSPCLSCLGVAILFALIYLLLRNSVPDQNKRFSLLLFFWSLLFAANLVLSVREMIPSQPIYGEIDAPVHVYFSPSCKACVKAINELKYKQEGTVAYFATAHDEADVARLISLRAKLGQGMSMSDALDAVLKEPVSTESIPLNQENLRLRWQLFRNKATILQFAGGSVPYITISQNLTGNEQASKQNKAPINNGTTEQNYLNNLNSQTNAAPSPFEHSPSATYDELNLLNSTDFGRCNDQSPEDCE